MFDGRLAITIKKKSRLQWFFTFFELQICDLPEKTGCVNEGISGSGNDEDDDEIGNSNAVDIIEDDGNRSINVSNTQNGDEDDNMRTGQRSGSMSMLPNGCPSYHIHYLLPHESDCTKFYYCVYGEKVLRQCALGLHFNPSTRVIFTS